ncbi:MAG: hypothetical protein MI921_08590 [Cytophagales bacterium]|nr:hypothetical protein [Cytophagales bacterium]
MAVLIIYSNYNHKVTKKVLTPENTHTKGNVNISNEGSGIKSRYKIFGKHVK